MQKVFVRRCSPILGLVKGPKALRSMLRIGPVGPKRSVNPPLTELCKSCYLLTYLALLLHGMRALINLLTGRILTLAIWIGMYNAAHL